MYRVKLVLVLGLAMSAAACITNGDKNPHNDVLIFGTSTKFALDVSAPVQNAGIPEFTLGYKRLEAVWMPLKPQAGVSNDTDIDQLIQKLSSCATKLKDQIKDTDERNRICLLAHIPSDKYVSLSAGVDPKTGGSVIEMDTYSVFASLGSKGGLSSTGASGNIAQFFATGVAAQRLGANPQIGMALNSEAPTAVVKQAEAKMEEAKLSPKEQVEIDNLRSSLAVETARATGCVAKWSSPPTSVPAGLKASAKKIANDYIQNKDLETLKARLEAFDLERKAIIAAC